MFIQFSIIILIIFIKAIFSAGDTALTYINKAKISQMSKTNFKAKKIKLLSENRTKFYGIIEVVITMCELFSSAFAAEFFITPLSGFLITLGLSSGIAIVLAVIIITMLLSYFLLVFGGILPKQIARNNPEKVAFHIIPVLWFVSILNRPFEKLVNSSTSLFAKLFHIAKNPKDKLTEKEIKMMIREGADQGVISKLEKDIALKALKFNDLTVKDIMIPSEKIDAIDITEPVDKVLKNIKKYAYTRIPVYEGDLNHIIGIFNIKDIVMEYAKHSKLNFSIQQFLREVTFVKPSDKIADVFTELQDRSQTISIVKNENQEVVGLISLEDILEVLVGKISDEYDKPADKKD